MGYYSSECDDYSSSPVVGIAIAAIVALVIARTIITATTGGCCMCCRTPNISTFARVCIVISWITSSIAVILFIVGAKVSGEKGGEIDVNGVYNCYTLRPGVFRAAGIIGLVSVLLGLVYYLLYVLARSRAAEKSGVDLELEKPPVTDFKEPTNL
ncbi:putative modifying wall lignin-1/2 [Helianthus annuus]|nr:putative modifying wall lignin-1/2 [Helianthus annuus]